jgi:hypothetical protein
MDQWLVRTTENFLAGPYTGDQIRQLIRERQLGLQDEICPANQYWISLHERDEVIRALGQEVAPYLVEHGDEDATQTQTQTEPTLDEAALAHAAAQHSDGATGVFQMPKASAPLPMIRRRPAVPTPLGAPLPASHVRVSPQAQRWKTVIWALATLSALAVFAVLRMLHSH